MKIRTLFTLLVLALLYTGCTDQLAGPELDTQNTTLPSLESAAKAASGGFADLSVRMRVHDNRTRWSDSLEIVVEVHNEGPHQASGLAIAYNDSLLRVLSASTSTSRGGYNDSLEVWTVDHLPTGATEKLVLTVRPTSRKTALATAEVSASDMRDPDSVPGDGDPRQDDYASVKIISRAKR